MDPCTISNQMCMKCTACPFWGIQQIYDILFGMIRLCVFNVQWSPFVGHWLLSGSDDTTARVWDTVIGKSIAELIGHTNKTRGLQWHMALQSIAMTGK